MAEVGRPSKYEDCRQKIEEAAAIGASDTEIAFYAGISRDTYYRWIKEIKGLSDRIDELREKPIMKARQTIVKALDNPSDAQWYLERKKKSEFAQRTELGGGDGEPIKIEITVDKTIEKIYGNGTG